MNWRKDVKKMQQNINVESQVSNAHKKIKKCAVCIDEMIRLKT